VGVGYGTDTGPRILLGAEYRRLNRAGHRYHGRVNLSEVEISLQAEYVMPSLYPDTHAWTIAALIARIDPVAYDTDRLAVGPTRSQPRFGWLESLTISWEHEDYTVGSDAGVTNLFVAGLTYRLKRADDDISPTRGYRVDVGMRVADEALLSSQSFLSATLSAKGVRALGGRFRVLGRVDTGITSTPSFRELPPTVRFFAGGDNSVRGFEYQSLGPRDEFGEVVGGDLLFTGSAELEMALFGKFALAAFFDAGDAFAGWYDGIVEQGIGGGLRWKSPVGPVRLDAAFPQNGDDVAFHFTMGPDL
jgi:translocation and assembly module TamA